MIILKNSNTSVE